MSFTEVMDRVRSRFPDNRERGDAFEAIIKQLFRSDPLYANRFKNVWLWSEWPGRGNQPDTGVDLVAEVVGGGYCAVQCKFYDDANAVKKGDVDTFLATSGRHPFTERLIVATTNKWSSNAESVLDGQQIPVARIGFDELRNSSIDWAAYLHDSSQMRRVATKTPRDYQAEAIDRVMAGFDEHDRGKMIMACGTGKTYTALAITERLANQLGRATRVLFLAPSISLINQTLRGWTADTTLPLRSFAVCSDTKVGRNNKSEDIAAHDVAIPATTDPERLAAGIDAHDTPGWEDTPSITAIFSTYQSIDVVAQAQNIGGGVFGRVRSHRLRRSAPYHRRHAGRRRRLGVCQSSR